jgi:hypothetical protein
VPDIDVDCWIKQRGLGKSGAGSTDFAAGLETDQQSDAENHDNGKVE